MRINVGSLAALLCLWAGTLILCGTAAAARPGFYIGGSLSNARRSIDKPQSDRLALDIYDTFGLTPVDTGHSTVDSNDNGYGFIVGYRFLRHLAAEVEYLDLGAQRYRALDVVSFDGEVFPIAARVKTRTSGLAASALGILPLSDHWEIYGRAGLVLTNDRIDLLLTDETGSGVAGSDEGSGTSLMAGGGISLGFANQYSIRVEFRRVFDAGDKNISGKRDIDLLSAGVLVQF